MLVATLVRQLTARFGEPTEAQLERIERAGDAELDAFVVRVLTADSADAVLGIE